MSDLFTEPPEQALVKMVAPIAVGFIMLMAIDYADALVADFISVQALAILGYCYPVLYFMIAIGFGLNQGMTIVASKGYVQRGLPALYGWLIQSTYLALLVSVLLCGVVLSVLHFGWIQSEFLTQYFTEIKPFLYVLIFAIFPTFVLLLLCASCQIRGQPDTIRDVLGIMFVGTCVFHPLFAIYLEYGLVGIAASKVINVFIGVLYMLFRTIGSVDMRGETKQFSLRQQGMLCHHALPASFIQLLVPMYLLYLTHIVTYFGVEALAGFHLGYRIVMFVIVPILGTLVALLALISHAYNEGDYQRIRQLLKVSLSKGSAIVCIALVITYIASRVLFMDLRETESIALSYILAAVFFTVLEYLMGVFIVSFQSIKRPLWGISVALTRTIVFPFPIFYWLTHYGLDQFNLYDIWYALILSFAISTIASYMIWYSKFYRYIVK